MFGQNQAKLPPYSGHTPAGDRLPAEKISLTRAKAIPPPHGRLDLPDRFGEYVGARRLGSQGGRE